ncbi:MAG TPA: methylmalonyl-CoA epimerase [Verrucomicrobiae bacterium]|nr:methylmalonyl-CoA epimerase [Verrucomicrobiae bacterium]
MNNPIRVLVAKPGLDGHDRGAKVVAQSLRDAGMEVIYTGLRQTPEQIVETALQEDVQVIGLSSLSGAHMQLFPAVVNILREQGAGDIVVLGGGVIPEEDVPYLKECGVAEIFGPGTSTKDIAKFIRQNFQSEGLTLTRIDHVGIAVHSLEHSLEFYTKVMGLQCSGIEEVQGQQVRVAFLPLGDSEIELLEPMSPDSGVAKFLESRGEGLHHIAYRVQDIHLAITQLKAQGIRLIDEKPRPGAGGALIAFLHPKSSGGVLTEICQRNSLTSH